MKIKDVTPGRVIAVILLSILLIVLILKLFVFSSGVEEVMLSPKSFT